MISLESLNFPKNGVRNTITKKIIAKFEEGSKNKDSKAVNDARRTIKYIILNEL